MNDGITILFPDSRKYKIGEREFELKPFVIDDYLAVFEDLVSCFAQIAKTNPGLDIKNFTIKDFVILLPVISKVKSIAARFLKIDEKEVGAICTVKDLAKLVLIFLEINDFKEIVANFQLAKEYISSVKVQKE